jgi:putative ABC transport system permease protein
MTIVDTFQIALNALKANKMRSFLTMLGVIIGVASVMVMVSISQSAQSQINDFIKSLGTNRLIVTPGSAAVGGRRGGAGTAKPFSEDDVNAIRALPDVLGATGALGGSAALIAGNVNWTTRIQGVNQDFLTVQDWPLSDGRNFTDQEIRSGAKVAILGKTIVTQMFDGYSPIGERIRINAVPFEVIGILAEKGQSNVGQDQDDTVLIPVAAARNRIIGRNMTVPRQVGAIQVKVADGAPLAEVQDDIENTLRVRRNVGIGQDDNFAVRNLTEMVKARTETQRTMGLLLAATGGVALIVGGIGIMNIMLVSVTERTREIGLRIAVGARQTTILMQFLVEAVSLCLLGGLIGIVLGIIAIFIMAAMGSWTVVISPVTILMAVGAAALVGVFFGYYPARKASQLNPIEALRHE